MQPSDAFPRELLTQPSETRLAYFTGKVVAHPRLKEAHQALLKAIHDPTRPALILVVGPTGVGKTTLRRGIERQLITEALPDLAHDPGRIPVVAVEAVASESGQFHWKDYYTRVLLALNEPLIDRKIASTIGKIDRNDHRRAIVEHVNSAPELRRALEQCLRQRRPTALIVDEAQHLRKSASARRLLDQMDTLKSLASLTGITHVLVGTYELLDLAHLSAQLSRRSVEIHFGRYTPNAATDLIAFRSVLLTFERHLPFATEPKLVEHWEELYERSVGCVGVLKSWLDRSLAAALAAGETTLTLRCLEQHAAPTRTLLSLAREIKEGEEAMGDGDRERPTLRALLGLSASPRSARMPQGDEKVSNEPGPNRARSPHGRAAQRRPERDPVGITEAPHGT